MRHSELIYQSIPSYVKRQFWANVAIILNKLIENIESNPFPLSNQESDFLTALGKAYGADDHSAVYEAFGKVLTDE